MVRREANVKMKFLSLLFSKKVYLVWSFIIKIALQARGISVGKCFYIEGTPYLKIRGRHQDLTIGDNVKIFGDVDFRNREKGKIIIKDNVEIDNDCRFVAANNAILTLEKSCKIGPYNIFNAGEDIFVGQDTISGGFCHVQSSNHGISLGKKIWEQSHTYGKIKIGEDVWLGANCTVLAGVSIGDGAVIAAKAVVTRNVNANEIHAGIPAKIKGKRSIASS